MTEPGLDRPGVVHLVGEGVTAGVAQHMWVRLQFGAGGRGGALDLVRDLAVKFAKLLAIG
jgi:hypothetical protein